MSQFNLAEHATLIRLEIKAWSAKAKCKEAAKAEEKPVAAPAPASEEEKK